MRREVSNRLIGLFVIIGILLMFGFVMAFGIGKYFQTEKQFVLYFEGSLHGLDVGAPVEFRGVKVGEVQEVRVELNQTTNELTLPVIISLQPHQIIETHEMPNKYTNHVFKKLIEKGLSAEIRSENILTGSLYIELDIQKQLNFKPHKNNFDLTEIPTFKIRSDKLSDMLKTAHSTLESIEKLVKSEKLNESIEDFSAMMKSGKVAMGSAENTMKDARHTMNNVDSVINPLSIKLMDTLGEFPDMVRAIRVFVDYLNRHPEALLKGKGN